MANKTLFTTTAGALLPAATVRNSEGSTAYAMSDAHALAQYVATGCLNSTYYADAEMQLKTVLELCAKVEPAFIAKAAVYGRERGYMKDMPALLLAVLASRDVALCEQIAPRVLDNGKMVRNFVQILRSGVTGRKSLGTVPKRIVRQWLARQTDDTLFRASVGNSPSLADIVKMVHPRPESAARKALYAYLIGRDHEAAALPELVQAYEAWKRDPSAKAPDVPFQMLASQELTAKQWAAIARKGGWHMVRMNLNTFARHGAFGVGDTAHLVAAKLRDPEAIRQAKAFPYQLLAAYLNADRGAAGTDAPLLSRLASSAFERLIRRGINPAATAVPELVIDALKDAMELAVANVPRLPGNVVVAVDVSGSMGMSISGYRAGATSKMRCVDVAGLIAAAVLRQNPQATLLPFDTEIRSAKIKATTSILSNAKKLAALGGGGTNCSLPIAELNAKKAKIDLVIMVSDNESWVDNNRYGATTMMKEWQTLKTRNPKAKLVCLDLVPNRTTQAADRQDILNIGGFSDTVFDLIADFAASRFHPRHWSQTIEAISLEPPLAT